MTAAVRQHEHSPALRDSVAEEVRSWLGRRRMSGAQLARLLGKSQTFVARRLDGRQAMDLDDLEMIAGVLNVSVVQLLGDAARRSGSSGTMGVDMAPYSPPSSRRRPDLRLVKGMVRDDADVTAGYGSSAAGAGAEHDQEADSGNDEDPQIAESTGVVDYAHTA